MYSTVPFVCARDTHDLEMILTKTDPIEVGKPTHSFAEKDRIDKQAEFEECFCAKFDQNQHKYWEQHFGNFNKWKTEFVELNVLNCFYIETQFFDSCCDPGFISPKDFQQKYSKHFEILKRK